MRVATACGRLLALSSLALAAACSGSDENPLPDADVISVDDGGVDASPDTSLDVPLDAPVDIVPDVTPSTCGNGVLDPGEACDGDLLGGAACDDFGFTSGVLGCTGVCTRDVSGCSEDPGPLCGDGIINGDEQCDGTNVGELTCADLGGFGDGVTCSDTCQAELGTCRTEAVCGDGFRDGEEECDDANTEADDGCSELCVVEDCHRAIRLDWYIDADGDGIGSGEPVAACASPGPRSVNVGGDCDDAAPDRFPGNPERCDGVDNDCDDTVDEDSTRVGEVCISGLEGACAAAFFACADGELVCAPLAAATPERCDGVDNDCDGDVDENADGSALSRACYSGPAGTLGVGVCAAGVQTCADAAWSGCDAPTLPGDEICNGLDDDCDGAADEEIATSTWYRDADGDGFGELGGESVTVEACGRPEGYAAVAGDCDDANNAVHPDAAEVCDGIDNNCDDVIDTDALRVGEACDSGLPGVCATAAFACADGELVCTQATAASEERCDGLDNDCDGDVDENPDGSSLSRACYGGPAGTAGIGSCSAGAQVCTGAVWSVCAGAILPAVETCNGNDDDCDGDVDEEIASSTWYRDFDGDGFGDSAAASVTVDACAAPEGYVANADDCNDADDLVNPDADEVCDGLDNNCDDVIDTDAIGVGDACDTGRLGACGRGRKVCADAELACVQTVFAAAELCNGQDDDCDGETDEIAPGEPLSRACYGGAPATAGVGVCTRGVETCDAGVWQTCAGEVLPASEVCDGLDNDCDGSTDEGAPLLSWYADNDGDGWGTGPAIQACRAPGANFVTQTGDCFDGNDAVSPGAEETLNGTDDNCDGNIDEDTPVFDDDGDGYCELGPCVGGLPDGDCDDNAPTVFPGGVELLDGLDNDCDGDADNRTPTLDDDGDGYCEVAPCVTGALGGGDCNDDDELIYPGAPERDNGIDDNCNGVIDDRKTWVGGDPSAPRSWGVAANWLPAGVPTTADDVFIPVRPNQPFLVANATVTSLRVADGAVLDLSGFTLTIREDLEAGDTIIGAGSVVMTGAAALLRGTISNVTVQGNVTLSGTTNVTGNLTLANASALYVGGHELNVSGNLSVALRSGAGLRMLDADDYVVVGGTATFNLEITTSAVGIDALRAGTLELRGNLVQTDAGTPTDVWAFGPNGTTVLFAGAAPQTVSFETPGAARSRFDDVVVADGANVTFTTAAYMSTLTLEGTGAVSGADLHFTEELPAIVPTYLVADTHVAADMVLGAGLDGYNPAQLTVDAGVTVTFSAPIAIAAPVDVAGTLSSGAQSVLIADLVQVVAGGTLRAGAGGLDLADSLVNAGSVLVDGALLDVAGGLTTTGPVTVGTGTLNVGGALSIGAEGNVTLTTGGLNVVGPTTTSGARSLLDAGDGTVTLGALQVTANNQGPSGLRVAEDALVTVNGDAVFTSVTVGLDTAANLTGGTIRFRRNFSSFRPCSVCDRTFASGGTRVVFDGSVAQTVFFETPGAASGRFTDVEFRNPAGVTASSAVWITGQATLALGTLDASDVYVTSRLPILAPDTNWSVDVTHAAGDVTALPSTVALPFLQVDAGATLSAVEATTFSGPVLVAGTLAQRGQAVSTNAAVEVTGLWLVEGGVWNASQPVLINGNNGGIIVGGGNATLSSLRIAPSGSNNRGLVMTNAADRVTVNGPLTVNEQAFFNGSSESSLTAGELRVRGNITQTNSTGSSGRSLVFNGTKLYLDGSLLQTVTFANNSATVSRLDDVVVSNASGVSFASPVWVTGRLTVSAGSSVSGNELVVTSLLPQIAGNFGISRLRVSAAALVPDMTTFTAPRLVIDAGSNLNLADDFTMNGALEVAGTVGVAGNTLVVDGALDVTNGAVELGGGVLEVLGATNLTGADGAIFVSGGTAEFASYRQVMMSDNSLGLVMRNVADRVFVAGSFISADDAFYSGTTENSFAAGELRVRGNFTQTAATGSNNRSFLTSGTTVHLDGTGSQTVTLAGNSTTTSHFGDLVVSTPGGVVFGSTVWIDGTLTVAAGSTVSGTDLVFTERLPRIQGSWAISRASIVSSDFVPDLAAIDLPILQVRAGSTLRLTAPFDLGGTLDVRGTTNLAGNNLDVAGNIEVTSGSVDLAGAQVSIGNDLIVTGSGATFSVNAGRVTVARDLTQQMFDGTAGVVMTNGADRLTIGRNMTVNISNLSGGTTEGRFTAGTLTVGGNITAGDGISNTGRTIVLTGTRLVLTGTTVIQLGANGPALSRFAAVDVEPGASVSMNSNVYSSGAWNVAGTLTVGNFRTLTTASTVTIQPTGILNLTGSIVSAGCINNGGTITGSGSGCPSP